MAIAEAINHQELNNAPQPSDVGEEVLRPIRVSEQTYNTNLPEGVNPFDTKNRSLRNTELVPSHLDELPLGDYFVSRTVMDDWAEPPKEVEERREIRVFNGDKGKVVGAEAFSERTSLQPNTAELMRLFGYQIDNVDGTDSVTGIPAPKTLKSSAGLVGVDVKLFPGHIHIPAREYLQAFSEGKFPVATKDEALYMHDMGDDHITAMALGGDILKDALKIAASDALAKGDEAVADATGSVDQFTATLRSIVAPGLLVGEAYGEDQGRETLIEIGGRLGINKDKVNEIIDYSQKTAKSLGMKLSELR